MTLIARIVADGAGYPYGRGAYVEVLGARYDVDACIAYARCRPLGETQGRGDLIRLTCIEPLPASAPLCSACGLPVATKGELHPRCRPSVNVRGRRGLSKWGGRAWDSKF